MGRGRTDLLVKWRYAAGSTSESGSASGDSLRWQKIVLELKVIGAGQRYQTVKAQALAQTAAYALTCGAEEAHIQIFDRAETRGWRERVFDDEGEHAGVRMRIWGM